MLFYLALKSNLTGWFFLILSVKCLFLCVFQWQSDGAQVGVASELMIFILFIFSSRTSGWKIDERSKPEVLGYQLSQGLEILLSRHRRGDDELGKKY